ncbi:MULTISPECIES: phosphopantetheine-binding protein [unclassified Micromonospora]|uniref:Acyl carrier protein n=1 Tax=Micromonospora sp. GMKU326 TaxID=718015 RepID=A0A0B6VPZ3_9ACTN|nr:phosphopantetheine-binding protein [Micromonospora sp. HK10]KKK06304.1 acyl carrier protein [Micromonospora sp. HK10]BAQ25503.1 acyl carrier protein [Micromonospora sp. GMKU326]
MNSLDDFLHLVTDEVGIPVNAEDARGDLDQVAGWDSVHLLTLLTVLEQRTGRTLALPDVLAARSLADIYDLAVTA